MPSTIGSRSDGNARRWSRQNPDRYDAFGGYARESVPGEIGGVAGTQRNRARLGRL